MIARKFRIPRSFFSRKPSARISSEYFQVKVFPNTLGHNRFAAVVGAKVDKRAVRRHFWRRIILDEAAKQPNSGRDFIIIANPKLGAAEKKDVVEDLKIISGK